MNDERVKALGANVIIGVDVDYETIDRGTDNCINMLMGSVSGTAVRAAKCSPVIGEYCPGRIKKNQL